MCPCRVDTRFIYNFIQSILIQVERIDLLIRILDYFVELNKQSSLFLSEILISRAGLCYQHGALPSQHSCRTEPSVQFAVSANGCAAAYFQGDRQAFPFCVVACFRSRFMLIHADEESFCLDGDRQGEHPRRMRSRRLQWRADLYVRTVIVSLFLCFAVSHFVSKSTKFPAFPFFISSHSFSLSFFALSKLSFSPLMSLCACPLSLFTHHLFHTYISAHVHTCAYTPS